MIESQLNRVGCVVISRLIKRCPQCPWILKLQGRIRQSVLEGLEVLSQRCQPLFNGVSESENTCNSHSTQRSGEMCEGLSDLIETQGLFAMGLLVRNHPTSAKLS